MFISRFITVFAFTSAFSIFTPSVHATVLQPGEIAIVTVNSDSGYLSAAPSNGFDFVTTVDLTAGTKVYFTDKGWDGSLPTPFWRNTTGEGVVEYTVPAGGLARGTIVHYNDEVVAADPTRWSMLQINPTTGVFSPGGGSAVFDPSVSGDNILVFQGDGANPVFLYAIGWATANPWISSGTPTTTNSWVPVDLQSLAHLVVSLGSTDNYQYNCVNLAMQTLSFFESVATPSAWNGNNTTPFPQSNCLFDATSPLVTINQHISQSDPTNSGSILFTVTFSEAIAVHTFDCSDITVSNGTCAQLTGLSATEFELQVSPLSDGPVVVSINQGTVTDVAGNPNAASTSTDNTVMYDVTPPSVGSAPNLQAASDSGTHSDDGVTNVIPPQFLVPCSETGATITLYSDVPAIETVLATGLCTSVGDLAIDATAFTIGAPGDHDGSHMITYTITDLALNESGHSPAMTLVLDTLAPSAPGIPDLLDTSDSGASATDDITNVSQPMLSMLCETGSTVRVFSGSTLVGSGACVANVATIQTMLLVDGTYVFTADQVDLAGNTSSHSSGLLVVVDTESPAPLSLLIVTTVTPSSFAFSGNCDDGTHVTIWANGTSLGQQTCTLGSFTITSSALTPGSYDVTSIVTDVAGNDSSPSASQTISILLPSPASSPPRSASSGGGRRNAQLRNSDFVNTLPNIVRSDPEYTGKCLVERPAVPLREVIPFLDISTTAWYADLIQTAVQLDVVSGLRDSIGNLENRFEPERPVLYAELLRMLFDTSDDLPEVRRVDDWYVPLLRTANKHKLLPVAEIVSLDFDTPLTRAQAVALLMVASCAPLDNVTFDQFPDVDSATEHGQAIMRAFERGIVQGYGDGYFRPNQVISRAEMVVLILRVLQSSQ